MLSIKNGFALGRAFLTSIPPSVVCVAFKKLPTRTPANPPSIQFLIVVRISVLISSLRTLTRLLIAHILKLVLTRSG